MNYVDVKKTNHHAKNHAKIILSWATKIPHQLIKLHLFFSMLAAWYMKVTSQRRGQGVSGILKYIYVLTKSAWVKNSQKNIEYIC